MHACKLALMIEYLEHWTVMCYRPHLHGLVFGENSDIIRRRPGGVGHYVRDK